MEKKQIFFFIIISIIIIFLLGVLNWFIMKPKNTATTQTNINTSGLRLFDITTSSQKSDNSKEIITLLKRLVLKNDVECESLKMLNVINSEIEANRQINETLVSISKTLKLLSARIETNTKVLYETQIALTKFKGVTP